MSDLEEYDNFHEICENYFISSKRIMDIEKVHINSRINDQKERNYYIEIYYSVNAGQEHPDGVCITDGTTDINSARLQLKVFLTKLDKIVNKIKGIT